MADGIRRWKVATALMTDASGRLLLVENLRRGGRIDWSPPGGVVDPGESVLGALGREVVEETGLLVAEWSPLTYTIDVQFAQQWILRVEAYVALQWSGDVVIDDPDGIVQQARFTATDQLATVLDTAPPWVHEPLDHWLTSAEAVHHRYHVEPRDEGGFAVASRNRDPLET